MTKPKSEPRHRRKEGRDVRSTLPIESFFQCSDLVAPSKRHFPWKKNSTGFVGKKPKHGCLTQSRPKIKPPFIPAKAFSCLFLKLFFLMNPLFIKSDKPTAKPGPIPGKSPGNQQVKKSNDRALELRSFASRSMGRS